MKFIRDDDVQREPREWSAVMLWVAVFVSINIVLGTITWNFARRIQQEHQLQDYATRSCTELLKAPGQSPASKDTKTCEAFVDAHHDTCLDQALRVASVKTFKPDEKVERYIADEYVTCLMSLPHDQRIALTSSP